MQLEEAIEDFLCYMEDQGKSDLTVSSYRYDYMQFMEYLKENQAPVVVEEIKPFRIQKFLRYRRRLGNSTSSTARKLHALSSFFKFCVKQEWIDRNPAENIDAPKIPETLPIILKDSEVSGLLSAANSARHYLAKRDRALIKVLLTTGVRRSEAINLDWEDIDFKEKTLTVRQGKGGKDRVIPLRDETLDDLWDYLQSRLPLTDRAVFFSRQRNRVSKDSISRTVSRYVRAAGISKKVTAHTFRHFFASHLLRQGVDVAVLKDLMGHRDISTTMKYTHSSNSLRRSAIDNISIPGLSNYAWNVPSMHSWKQKGENNDEK